MKMQMQMQMQVQVQVQRQVQVLPFAKDDKVGRWMTRVRWFVASLDIRQELEHSVVECRGKRMGTSSDLLQGTLDLLVLKTLALEPMHGWGIAQRIQQVSKEALQIGQGSLYPALHRLEYKGWIQADWGASENNRRARFYSLTRAGKKQLAAELENWDRLTTAIALVLKQV
jgi:PadR family transcriptional regulator PadR